jgi:hypothetical protein
MRTPVGDSGMKGGVQRCAGSEREAGTRMIRRAFGAVFPDVEPGISIQSR